MTLGTLAKLGTVSLLLAANCAFGQQVYRFVDEFGRVVFTDRPPEGREAEAVPLSPPAPLQERGGEGVAERVDRLMGVADQLQADRLAREEQRAAARRAPAAEQPPPAEPMETAGVTTGIWYPGPLRPPRPWWPWVPGYPPAHHPGHPPRPPVHAPGGPEMLPPPPARPPSGRITWPSGK